MQDISRHSGTLIGAGIVAYCPEYVDDIDSVGDPA